MKNCFSNSSYQYDDIDLLIHTGVYRSEYILEPAYATLLAGEFDMNSTYSDSGNNTTLAFDIFNGALGFLNACYVAQQMIAAKNCRTAMIVAAEIENNAESFPDELMNIRETGSAIILDSSPSEETGFSQFLFSYNSETLSAYSTFCNTENKTPYLNIKKDPNLNDFYIDSIFPAVQELLEKEGLDLNEINIVLPPQISSAFISRLSKSLGLNREKFVNVVGEGKDFFTSSLVYALHAAYKNNLVKPGDKGLIIAIGSGIQVGCAIYHF